MSKNLFEDRKREFIDFVTMEHRLPKTWEKKFNDGEDMRIWFDNISKIDNYKVFVNEVYDVLDSKKLSDKEKEEEFREYISKFNKVPGYREAYFSDNSDMYLWYMNYKKKNNDFETSIHNELKEYQELDLARDWPDIKEEFRDIIKKLKRIPRHGEVVLQNGTDVRAVFDKLETFDPLYVERILLHLQTYNNKALSIDDRKKELLDMISILGYIPDFRESRFTDGTDMFTWYMKYRKKIANLDNEIKLLITKEQPKKKVNIYLIPNFRKTGGRFYTICTNEGELLDLSEISIEDAKKSDSTFTKRGGVILKRDEEIGEVSVSKVRTK